MELKTLYKLTANNKINHWTVKVENDYYYTVYGQIGGKSVTTPPIYATPKNIGKSNETTAEQQALLEAQALWKNKKKSNNCVENIDDVYKLAFNPPMLAKIYDKKYKNDMTHIQPKYDGIRMNIWYNNGNIQALSRRNNPFYTVNHIIESISNILETHPSIHLDGELYNHKLHNDFNRIVSLVRKEKLTENEINELKTLPLCYVIYDMWDDDNPSLTFSERNEILRDLFKDNPQYIILAPTYEVSNSEMIDEYFHQFLQEGYEGAIIRKNKPYEHKRSSNLLKYKEFDDDEFEILEVCEGNIKGKAEYCWIDLKNGKTCKATLGFNDEICADLLNNKDKVKGCHATVRFFGWTPDGKLRFPVVKIIDRNYE